MDRFVIRIPKDGPKPNWKQSAGLWSAKRLRQSRIENLAGVISLDELERCKTLAKLQGGDYLGLLDCLKSLAKKKPAAEIIMRTKIGPVIHQLTKHANEEVAAQAKVVYKAWKKHALSSANRKNIEVQYDGKTTMTRQKARELLAKALAEGAETDDSVEAIADCMEEELFRLHRRLLTADYKRSVRRLVFALRHDAAFLVSVRTGVVSPTTAVAERASSSATHPSSSSTSSS